MNKSNLIRPLLTLALVMLALYTGIRLGKVSGDPNAPKALNLLMPRQDKLSTVLGYISRYYVDSVSIDKLADAAIPAILKELDPHSVYIPAENLQQSNESLEGNFDGIGVTFQMPNDTAIVLNVIGGGPSSDKVYPGDRIMTVNDSLIAGRKVPQDSVVRLLRGKAGTNVKIGLKREGESKLVSATITRGKVSIVSIDAMYMISPNTGYVRMNKFSRSTHAEFVKAADSLHKSGMTNVILDLRGNNGGFLGQAFDMGSEFLPKNTAIVYTEGRALKRESMYSNGSGICLTDKLVVLIDEESASASEILAGAIQDNDRGTIIGRRSFGKGLVQKPIELEDGSGMRLTIGRYYTPSGRCIQRPYLHGAEGEEDYFLELSRRYRSGEMLYADSMKQNDSTKYYTVNGRVVYGGGGITPDVFVPADTMNNYSIAVRRKNLVYNYALKFSDSRREALRRIKSIADLNNFFVRNDPYSGFTAYATQNGVKGTPEEISQSKSLIEAQLKAFAGRTTVLGETGSAYYFNKIDNTVQVALKQLDELNSDNKPKVEN